MYKRQRSNRAQARSSRTLKRNVATSKATRRSNPKGAQRNHSAVRVRANRASRVVRALRLNKIGRLQRGKLSNAKVKGGGRIQRFRNRSTKATDTKLSRVKLQRTRVKLLSKSIGLKEALRKLISKNRNIKANRTEKEDKQKLDRKGARTNQEKQSLKQKSEAKEKKESKGNVVAEKEHEKESKLSKTQEKLDKKEKIEERSDEEREVLKVKSEKEENKTKQNATEINKNESEQKQQTVAVIAELQAQTIQKALINNQRIVAIEALTALLDLKQALQKELSSDSAEMQQLDYLIDLITTKKRKKKISNADDSGLHFEDTLDDDLAGELLRFLNELSITSSGVQPEFELDTFNNTDTQIDETLDDELEMAPLFVSASDEGPKNELDIVQVKQLDATDDNSTTSLDE